MAQVCVCYLRVLAQNQSRGCESVAEVFWQSPGGTRNNVVSLSWCVNINASLLLEKAFPQSEHHLSVKADRRIRDLLILASISLLNTHEINGLDFYSFFSLKSDYIMSLVYWSVQSSRTLGNFHYPVSLCILAQMPDKILNYQIRWQSWCSSTEVDFCWLSQLFSLKSWQNNIKHWSLDNQQRLARERNRNRCLIFEPADK